MHALGWTGGLSPHLTTALVNHHFVDQGRSPSCGEREKCPSSSSVEVPLRHGREPIVEVLEHHPVLHAMLGTGQDVFLKPFPCLGYSFYGFLLEVGNPSPKSVGFAHREELSEECRGTFVPRVDCFRVLVEPPLRFPHKGEREKTEPDDVGGDVFDDDRVTELQEVLKMSVRILVRQATERACLHYGDQASSEFKVLFGRVNNGPSGHVGDSGDEKLVKGTGHLLS